MSIRQLADEVASEIFELSNKNKDNSKEVSQIVEKALLKVMRDSQEGCVDVVNICCSADQDLAHKIAGELKQKENLLITNLMSLR